MQVATVSPLICLPTPLEKTARGMLTAQLLPRNPLLAPTHSAQTKRTKRRKVLRVVAASCSDYAEPESLLCHGLTCFDACHGLLLTQQCLMLKRAFYFILFFISIYVFWAKSTNE